MIPNRKSELGQWVRSQLGEPVMDTFQLESTQLENCIDDAIDYYQLFSGGIGHEENYAVINVGCPSGASICSLSGEPFTFCDPTVLAAPFLQHRGEFQLPKSVIALAPALQQSSGGSRGGSWLTQAPGTDIIEKGLNAAESMSNTMAGFVGAGGPINTFTNNYIGSFFPGSFYNGGPYGTRGGYRGAGMGMDIITYELANQYMEMLNQRYTVHVALQFLEAQRKVRITPPPRVGGVYVIPVWSRVAPEYLYDDYFIRHYTLALAMMQIGRTMQKYTGGTFQGAQAFNSEFYYNEGKTQKEKLEQELQDSKFGYPIRAFYTG